MRLVLLLALLAPQEAPVRRFGDPRPRDPLPTFAGRVFALGPDEVVVFAGQTNLVLESENAELETRLAASFAGSKPRFRNMAWEGDTVYDQYRELNFGDWRAQLAAAEATVVVAQFGQMEAFDGRARLPDFVAAYEKLLDQFAGVTRRLVLLSPSLFEGPAGPHSPDLTERNDDVRAYAEAVAAIAARRQAVYVDLTLPAAQRRTTDGIHWNAEGRRDVSKRIAEALGAKAEGPEALRREIVEKNRLWFDCWRTMNWAFAYGDRTTQLFPTAVAGRPSLVDELKQFRGLLRAADERVQTLAAGHPAPPPPPPPPPDPGAKADLTPEQQLASFVPREGFEVSLVASEADGVVKPVQVRFDARGRIWLCCIPTYPQIEPGAKPSDFILVGEDTDADGRYDRWTRFAEGLMMPMGLEFGDGGVYVCESTRIVHLRDTDGDGKADERRLVLAGFGTGDSHQLINSMVWSPDGDLWFAQGLHVISRVETPWGLSRLEKAGVWRLNPRRLQLQGFFNQAAAGANTWGVVFDDFGQVFHNACDTAHGYYSVPGMVPTLHRLAHPQRMLVSRTKNMSLDIVGTRHLPDDLQGTVLTCVYFGNDVEAHRLADDGSGFSSKVQASLLRSTRPEFRPVDLRIGPDGALYVCDWYNKIIGHYQASYRHPDRDKSHGRIWRLKYKDRPLEKTPAFASMTTPQLLDLLKSPERVHRALAKRTLWDRPQGEVIAALDSWLPGQDERTRLEALGLCAGHEALRTGLLHGLLKSADPRVRAFATRTVGRWADRLQDPLSPLRERVADEHPRVRLEAVVASSYVARPEAIQVAALALDRPRDRYIDYALTQAVHALKPQWRPALAAGRLDFAGRGAHLAFILAADGTPDVAGFLRKLAESEGDAATREGLLVLLAEVGDAGQLAWAFAQGKAHPSVLDALAVAARVRGVRPSGQAPLEGLPTTPALFRLAAAWKSAPLAPRVREAALSGASLELRRAAIDALPALLGPEALPVLGGLVDSPQVRGASIAAILDLDAPEAARRAAPLLAAAKTREESAELLTPFLLRQAGPPALARTLDGSIAADAAKLALRVLSTAGRDDAALVAVLNKAAGIGNPRPEWTPDLVAQLAAEVKAKGDAKRGQAVYASPLANCAACHRIDGQGGPVGPELSALGRGAPLEHLIESVLWPRRTIKEGYLTVLVLTEDGEVYQGQKIRESATELVLRDLAADREIRLARSRIRQLKDAGTAMPENLTDGMTRGEIVDLVRYLSELGR
jgi:putative heme-binding domain-containing protein